jgi:hypothetical protein
MPRDFVDAAIPVDDMVAEEHLYEWDKENLDMYVGTCYPCIEDFRLEVRQHAIVNEFELGTKKSNRGRFRGLLWVSWLPLAYGS